LTASVHMVQNFLDQFKWDNRTEGRILNSLVAIFIVKMLNLLQGLTSGLSVTKNMVTRPHIVPLAPGKVSKMVSIEFETLYCQILAHTPLLLVPLINPMTILSLPFFRSPWDRFCR